MDIAVLTYRRPEAIAALLPALVAQARAAGGDGWRTRVVVVDNCPNASAREIIVGARYDVTDVVYRHEPQPGISAGRNRALDEAADADFLAFIDDDEEPGEAWLRELLACAERTGADAVAGPIIPCYEVEPSPYIAAGGFFVRPDPPDGSALTMAPTSNLLLRMETVRRLGLRFDPALGLIGGEDNVFTRQLTDAGGSLVRCGTAPVVDRVPAARMTRDWVLRRRFRGGTTTSMVELRRSPQGARRVLVRSQLTVLGASRLGGGAARWAWGGATGSVTHRARGMRTAYRGAGIIAGAWGGVVEEYARPVSGESPDGT